VAAHPRVRTPCIPGGECDADFAMVPSMSQRPSISQHLIAQLQGGGIESVAFVVPSDARWTLPLYEEAITTARRGWRLGIRAATYWFVTPEPAPPAGYESLETEGITLIGSTYADVRGGVVLLDPQGEHIEPDRIVTLNENGELLLDRRATRGAVAA
jgi:hypothetical protein